jgi:hypothetical protein
MPNILFKSRLNAKYKKIFSIIAFFLTTIFFLSENVFGKVLELANRNQEYNIISTASFEPLVYLLGVFALYSIIASIIIIFIGEIYIRFCEYFKIKSKLYDYMSKTKDVMTMNGVEYYEKYKEDEDGNKNN